MGSDGVLGDDGHLADGADAADKVELTLQEAEAAADGAMVGDVIGDERETDPLPAPPEHQRRPRPQRHALRSRDENVHPGMVALPNGVRAIGAVPADPLGRSPWAGGPSWTSVRIAGSSAATAARTVCAAGTGQARAGATSASRRRIAADEGGLRIGAMPSAARAGPFPNLLRPTSVRTAWAWHVIPSSRKRASPRRAVRRTRSASRGAGPSGSPSSGPDRGTAKGLLTFLRRVAGGNRPVCPPMPHSFPADCGTRTWVPNRDSRSASGHETPARAPRLSATPCPCRSNKRGLPTRTSTSSAARSRRRVARR